MLEGKRISELETVTNLQTGCCFPVLSTGATKRIAFGSLLSEIENNLPETGIEQVKEDVAKLKVKTEQIDTLSADVENVKEEVANVDEMVQGQNATIRNCVSTVEGLEQIIEQTHFDDVLELEGQVRANTANIERNASNIETKQDALNAAQTEAVNSGITAEKVALIPTGAVAQIDDTTKANNKAWSSSKIVIELDKITPYIYTGRNLMDVLGTSTVAETMAALQAKSNAGNFDGLGLGDYIDLPSLTVEGTTYTWNDDYENLRFEIIGFDHYYGYGDNSYTVHHIIMQAKNIPFKHIMNTSKTNNGGYRDSALRTWLLNNVVNAMETSLGITLKTPYRTISTKSNEAWVNDKVFILDCVEILGWLPYLDGRVENIASKQFPLYAIKTRNVKKYNGSPDEWYTEDVRFGTGNTTFVKIGGGGSYWTDNADVARGIAFAFAI